MELYRVTTHYPLRNGKPGQRTEILQRRHAVSTRIQDANSLAMYRFTNGQENDYFVLAEKLVDGEWIPIDCLTGPDRFFTCDLTYESMKEWTARHD